MSQSRGAGGRSPGRHVPIPWRGGGVPAGLPQPCRALCRLHGAGANLLGLLPTFPGAGTSLLVLLPPPRDWDMPAGAPPCLHGARTSRPGLFLSFPRAGTCLLGLLPQSPGPGKACWDSSPPPRDWDMPAGTPPHLHLAAVALLAPPEARSSHFRVGKFSEL